MTSSNIDRSDKEAAALHALSRCATPYGLMVIAGNDVTDESMFRPDVPNLVSIEVGKGDTRARNQVPVPFDLRRNLAQAGAGAS